MHFLKTVLLNQGLVWTHFTARGQWHFGLLYWQHYGDASYAKRKSGRQAYDKCQIHCVTSFHASWSIPPHLAGSRPGYHCLALPSADSPGRLVAQLAGWHSAQSVCWLSATSPLQAHFQFSHLDKNMKVGENNTINFRNCDKRGQVRNVKGKVSL